MYKFRNTNKLLLVILDIISIFSAYFFALIARFSFEIPSSQIYIMLTILIPVIIIYIFSFNICKMYDSIWGLAGIDEVIYVVLGSIIGTSLSLIYLSLVNTGASRIVVLVTGLITMIITMGIRIFYRIIRRISLYGIPMKNITDNKSKRVLVVGAGSAAKIILREMRRHNYSEFTPVAIVDDNPNKKGSYLYGIKIEGSIKDIDKIVKEKNIELIMVAIPSISGEKRKEIFSICSKTEKKVKVIPSLYEMIDGNVSIKNMRDVDLKDLLGREEISLDKAGIDKYIKDKIILVTGGGGSIGSELCRQISKFKPSKLLILDIYENNAYDLENELKRKFPNLNQEVLIASVRDKNRLLDIFEKYKPEIVFHAAAHKHVPLMEANPMEAIKNNVKGTLNVAEISSLNGVERFVLISTDKAVNPTNVMGATKRMCEMIIQAINRESKTEFVAVRFGNVLGSNGSVIPLFKKQIEEGGPLTITHKDITRFFMLIPEAAQLVLQAGAYAKGGEIFLLDMGSPVKIYDLAEQLIKLSGLEKGKDIDIKITGLRPGEKLYEELLMEEEKVKTNHEKIFIGKPGEFNLEKLKTDIESLLKLTRTNDIEKLKNKIKEIVPTYKKAEYESEIYVAATKIKGQQK